MLTTDRIFDQVVVPFSDDSGGANFSLVGPLPIKLRTASTEKLWKFILDGALGQSKTLQVIFGTFGRPMFRVTAESDS
jgi:hypothetical protein